jgi:hypothetical protein
MSNLFDIASEYLMILDELEENGGELTDDILDRLNINRDELNDKLENYRKVIAMYEGQIRTLGEEVDRLKAKMKVKNNIIDRLKDRIKIAISTYGNPTKTGSKSYETEFSKFTFVKTKSVVFDDDFELTLRDTKLKPYIKGDISIKATGDGILDIQNKLIALGLSYSTTLNVLKTDLKPILEHDPEYFEHIRLDTEGGYVRIS